MEALYPQYYLEENNDIDADALMYPCIENMLSSYALVTFCMMQVKFKAPPKVI